MTPSRNADSIPIAKLDMAITSLARYLIEQQHRFEGFIRGKRGHAKMRSSSVNRIKELEKGNPNHIRRSHLVHGSALSLPARSE